MADERELWNKCAKHKSWKRKIGICPKCLREHLVSLCPECAGALPCSSCPAQAVDSSSSSSSSSNSFSLFAFSRGGSRRDYAPPCTVTAESVRVPNYPENESSLRKSRSVALPFLRSRSRYVGGPVAGCDSVLVSENDKPQPKVSRSKISFWSAFSNKSKKCDVNGEEIDDYQINKMCDLPVVVDMMRRSRSVAVGGPSPWKRKRWYFPSPVKGILNSKPHKSVAVV